MQSTMPADIPKVWDEVFSFANTAHSTHTHIRQLFIRKTDLHIMERQTIFSLMVLLVVVVVWPQHDKRTQTTQ